MMMEVVNNNTPGCLTRPHSLVMQLQRHSLQWRHARPALPAVQLLEGQCLKGQCPTRPAGCRSIVGQRPSPPWHHARQALRAVQPQGLQGCRPVGPHSVVMQVQRPRVCPARPANCRSAATQPQGQWLHGRPALPAVHPQGPRLQGCPAMPALAAVVQQLLQGCLARPHNEVQLQRPRGCPASPVNCHSPAMQPQGQRLHARPALLAVRLQS